MGKQSSIARYNKRKAAGLCTRCGEVPPKEGILLCPDCSQSEKERLSKGEYHKRYIRKNTNETKKRRIAEGFCPLCGKRPPRDGMRDCQECADKRNIRSIELIQARYDKGLCHCGNEKVPDYSVCQGCLDRQRKQTEYKQVNNICRSCPEPAVPNRTRCAKHLLDMQIRNLDVLPEEKSKVLVAVNAFDGICQNPGCGATTPGSERQSWHLDHCHETKLFRGILCMHCNSLLGYGKDNQEILAGAIEYLKRFESRGISTTGHVFAGQPQLDPPKLC